MCMSLAAGIVIITCPEIWVLFVFQILTIPSEYELTFASVKSDRYSIASTHMGAFSQGSFARGPAAVYFLWGVIVCRFDDLRLVSGDEPAGDGCMGWSILDDPAVCLCQCGSKEFFGRGE